MAILLGLVSLLTGTTKSVSVCGINSAAVAQPRIGVGYGMVACYLVSLFVGASVLVLICVGIGTTTVQAFAISPSLRERFVLVAFVVVGSAEILHGPWLFPHVAWAVPRSWARIRGLGLPLFGFIRGLSIFNHSPYASMHAWVLAMIILADSVDPLFVAAMLAAGLAFWTLAYGFGVVVYRDGLALFDGWTRAALLAPRRIARLDGSMLVSAGLLGLAAAGLPHV
jgi:hypothetical protein